MTQNTIQTVIAYYNNRHFLDVLEKFNKKDMIFSIYNKSSHDINGILSDSIRENSRTTCIENKGREGDTYLHHIIENYDNLSDYTLFIQDDTNNHIQNIDEFICITNRIVEEGTLFYQYETTWNENGIITNRRIRDGRLHLSTISQPYAIKHACAELHINLPGIYVTPTCAFFIVHKSIIHRHSKKFYQNVRTWLLQKDENGYILEHIWKLIFDNMNTGIKSRNSNMTELIRVNAVKTIIKYLKKYKSIRVDINL